MASYRFCRTDDVALLVAAYNRCYRPHFPDEPELTVDAFRLLIRERNLWLDLHLLVRTVPAVLTGRGAC